MSGELAAILRRLGTRTRVLGAGEFLFQRDDVVRWLFIMEEGEVHLTRFQPDGSQLVLQRAVDGQVVAEASVFSTKYHCDAMAIQPSRITELSRQTFRAALNSEPLLADAWNTYLAREVQATRMRAEILSLRTVAGRLDAWLTLHSGKLPEKGEWKFLANEIGVSPEALYRELAKRSGD